jgi:protein involved in polysaccharide export with SLBB domain
MSNRTPIKHRKAGSTPRFGRVLLAAITGALTASVAAAQSPSVLTSRAELTVAAQQAENLAASSNGAVSTKNRLVAASIRQRLTTGDFLVGDRIVLSYISDIPHTDTLVVRSGPMLSLPANGSLSLAGVLRSELRSKVEAEVLKYIKAVEIEVTPLTRVGILGEVAHPGYFALRSDVPLADAIMVAGGPTAAADVDRTVVRRGKDEVRSIDETRQAIARGLTLDQFGLSAGDEIVIAHRRELLSGSVMPIVGALASIAAIFVAVHH